MVEGFGFFSFGAWGWRGTGRGEGGSCQWYCRRRKWVALVGGLGRGVGLDLVGVNWTGLGWIGLGSWGFEIGIRRRCGTVVGTGSCQQTFCRRMEDGVGKTYMTGFKATAREREESDVIHCIRVDDAPWVSTRRRATYIFMLACPDEAVTGKGGDGSGCCV